LFKSETGTPPQSPLLCQARQAARLQIIAGMTQAKVEAILQGV